MNDVLLVAQILLGLLVSVLILVQARGNGFARSSTEASFTRRGLEQLVFRTSFVAATLFIVLSIASIL